MEYNNDRLGRTVAVVGLGYVGLPLALLCIKQGYAVIGIDTDCQKIGSLLRGDSYIGHIPSDQIRQAISKKVFTASASHSAVAMADVVILCVPTPLRDNDTPDLSFIKASVRAVSKHLKRGVLLALESTTYPGTTRNEVMSILRYEAGRSVGEDYYLGYSPEREDPGNTIFNTQNIPKIVSGITNECLDVCDSFYKSIVDCTIRVSSPEVAEMAKLTENIHRAVNIGLVNEIKTICQGLSINTQEVLKAAATKPFGYTHYQPGIGIGGHCLPVDPYYLVWKAESLNIQAPLISSAVAVNRNMPNWILGKLESILSQKNISIADSKIVVVGVSYKKDSDDLRESPALHLLTLLNDARSVVRYHDPLVDSIKLSRKIRKEYTSIDLRSDFVRDADLVIIAVAHSGIDYKFLLDNASLIIDCQGVLDEKNSNVVHL